MVSKTVIITGGNTGLGYACAHHILRCDNSWHVVIACRNEQKAKEAREKLIDETNNKNVTFQQLDLSRFQSVRDFVNDYLQREYPPLSGIICNAGVSLGDAITKTVDGVETTFQVNCLSHFLLVNLLLPHLSKDGRILFVSSELHRNDGPMKNFRPEFKSAKDSAYPDVSLGSLKHSGSKRYSTSKLCLLFYTYELNKRLASEKTKNITVNAFNPGLMPDTGLGGLSKMFFTRLFLKYILPLFTKGAVSNPSRSGRILAELLVNSDYKSMSGKYFDRDKMIESSKESYDQAKWVDLWDFSKRVTQLS